MSTKKPSSKERQRATRMRKEERADLLLDTAVSVFAKKGLGNAKHADIASAAGMSVAATFVYFPTRDDLVNSVLDEISRLILDEVLQQDDSEEPPNKRLQAIAFAFVNAATSHPDHIKVWLMWSTLFEPTARKRYLKFEQKTLNRLAQTVPDGAHTMPKEEIARLTLGGATMLAQMVLSGEDIDKRERLINYYLNNFFRIPDSE